MKISAHAKYQIIYDTLQKNDNLLNVAAMCEIAGVSRSGYYHYLSTEDQRMEREERDRQDCKLRLNGTPVPLLRNGYSIFNGTKYR